MQFLQSFDFLTGVNPGLKTFVYFLIVIHLLAVSAWCAYACPTMFKQEQSFADKIQKQLKNKKTN